MSLAGNSSRVISLLIAIIVGGLSLALSVSPLGERIEVGLLDTWFKVRGSREPPADFVIIAIDEQSYADLKVPLNQPWPRALHARLLNRLADLKAKRAVFDILFLDPGTDPQADEALAQAIKRLPVYLGVDSAMQQIGGSSGTYSIEELLEPYEPFRDAAAGLGLVSLPDSQGSIRRFLSTRSDRTKFIPSLAETGADITPADDNLKPGPDDFIQYYGPARTFPVLSYYQLLDEQVTIPKHMLENKTVFVGLLLRTETGPAQKDVFASPFGGPGIFGVEVHATAAANLKTKSWIRRLPLWVERLGAFLIPAGATLGLLFLNPLYGAVLVLITLGIWAGISLAAFFNQLFVIGLIPVLLLVPLTYLGTTLYYYFVTRKSEQKMRGAFELYLSPQMVKQLDLESGALKLGGEKLWATALFTDIAGFTAITEEMPAERVSEMLNAYFTEVMEVVFQNQGTLIKFIGDAVFVLWGAPIKLPNHAELAIKTALAIDAEVERFNKSGRFPPLNTRIGVNTGPMVVGNLGSRRRFDYTAIGDSVNLASRVEGINKYLGTKVLFTEACRKDAGNSINALRVASVQVSGKKEVINLYSTWREPLPSGVVSLWEEALQEFSNRSFAKAAELFSKVAAQEPRLSQTAAFYAHQIAHYSTTPPAPGWAGAVTFESK